MSEEYLLVLPIEPIPARGMYPKGRSLPLHCTVMHWFELDRGRLAELDMELEELVLQPRFEKIELVSERPELFGPNNDVPVHLLAPNEPLGQLHTQLFHFLMEIDNLPRELRWTGANYRPHVTDTPERRFTPGMQHRPTSLALIQRKEDGGKLVIVDYTLGRALL